jgi:Cytochrome c oxidase subunit IV
VKLESLLWASVAVYFGALAALYAAVGGSPAGVVILVAAAAFGGLVAGWSWRWSRRNPPRPADLDTADVSDEAGPAGIYPAASLRPLGLGAGFTITLAGIPLGSWMVAAGIALLASQVGLLVRDRDA